MTKIPFEPTITGAYRFVFSNIGSIIGIGWFPFLLFAAVAGGAAVTAFPLFSGLLIEGTNQVDTARLGAVIGQLIGTFALVGIALIFAQAMVNVGLMRKALGQHPGPVFIFFSLGSQVWQLIGSYLLLMLLAWGSIALGAGAITALAFLLQKFAPVAATAVAVLSAIALYVFTIYAVIRTTFFIPAVVVAENHIGLRRAWHLGRGNFWRIVGVMIVVMLPPAIVMSTVTQVIVQFVVGQPAVLNAGASDAEVQAFVQKIVASFIKIGPYFAVLELLYIILLSGLLVGAGAVAYKLVTGTDAGTAKASA